MDVYDSCYQLTEKGIAQYRRLFFGEVPNGVLDSSDVSIAVPVNDTGQLRVHECHTAKDVAQQIVMSVPAKLVRSLLNNTGLWCWLTYTYRKELFPRDSRGNWKAKETPRWFPSHPNDWRKAQRHLIRMPVQLYAAFGSDADHLLCGKPSVVPEIREQLTSQQDMFDRHFQRLARRLYFDSSRKVVKVGAGGKGPGSARRLAQVRRQFDMTWDLGELSLDAVMAMLPSEFDRFKAP